MKWEDYDSPSAQHARQNPRPPAAPPHWTRCEEISAKGERCLRAAHVDSAHKFESEVLEKKP